MSLIHWDELIEESPEVMRGKPVFKGTRITGELVLKAMGAGSTQDDVLLEFPQLQRQHLLAALLNFNSAI